jgi:hypothetical protein
MIIGITLTLLSSIIILSKYIDFAKFMIERKSKDPETRVIQFNHPRHFKKDKQQDIVIDIPVEEVKVLQYKDD